MQTVLDFLYSAFQSIYLLGDRTYIYEDNGIRISINSFLIALVIITIILTATINTVRYRVGNSYSGLGRNFEKSNMPTKAELKRTNKRNTK